MFTKYNISQIKTSMAVQSGVATVVKMTAAFLSFLMTLAFTRTLEKVDAGYVFTFISVVTIAATFSRMGTDNAVLRFAATSGLEDRRFFGRLAVVIVGVALFTSTVGALYLVFSEQVVAVSVLLCAIVIATCAMALGIYLAFVLRGAGKTKLSIWLQSGGIPGFVIVILAAVTFSGLTTNAGLSILIFALAALANATMAFSFFMRKRSNGSTAVEEKIPAFLLECRPLYLLATIQILTQWLPILLIGQLADLAAAAEFQVASRIAMLIGLVQAGVTTVTAPRMAKAWHLDDSTEVFAVYRKAMKLSIIISTVGVAAIALLSEFITNLFGDFSEAIPLLLVLLVGQLVGAYSGPIINLLTMTRNQSLLKLPALVSGISLLAIGVFAGWLYGAIGVAVAVVVSTTAQNIFALLAAKRKLGITYFGQ